MIIVLIICYSYIVHYLPPSYYCICMNIHHNCVKLQNIFFLQAGIPVRGGAAPAFPTSTLVHSPPPDSKPAPSPKPLPPTLPPPPAAAAGGISSTRGASSERATPPRLENPVLASHKNGGNPHAAGGSKAGHASTLARTAPRVPGAMNASGAGNFLGKAL